MKIPYIRRFLAGLLVVCMTVPMFPVALAQETDQTCVVCGAADGVHQDGCEQMSQASEETIPVTTDPAETIPVLTETGEMEPEETEPTETKSEETKSEETEPTETKSEETEPEETEPEETEPEETEPEQTELAEAVPAENELDVMGQEKGMDVLGAELRGTGPTMTARLYNSNKTTQYAQLNTAAEGRNVFEGWGFENAATNYAMSEEVLLFIELSGLDPNIATTVTVEMDQILYASPVPDAAVSFVQNEVITANKGAVKYVGGQYPNTANQANGGKGTSGTIIFSVTGKTEETLAVNLYFDPALWNRQAGALLNTSTDNPILKVSMAPENGESTIVKLDDATAANAHYYNLRRYISFSVAPKVGSSTYYSGHVASAPVDSQVIAFIRGYAYGSDYTEYYMDKLTVRFKLPTCKINGTEYTMLVEKYQDLGDKGTKGYDYTLEEKNGYLYVVYNKLYADECILGRICLRFPEIPGLQQGDTYTFNGNTYFFIGDEGGEEILPQQINGTDGHPFTINLKHVDGGKLEYECTEHYVEDETIDGAVNAMGAYTLKNTGNQDTTPITVRMTFNNRQGNNNLGVTTVKLMADPAQSAGTRVKYTLMDENGNVVDNNGQPFEITLTHKYSAYDTQTQKRILFTISKATANLNLPAGHDYYFKTITYDIEKITAGYAYMSGFYDNSPGVYYGRSLTGTLASNTTGYTKIQVFDKESGEELESLQEELVTTLYVYNRGAFYLEDVTAQTPTGEYEVTAGDTFGLALQGRVYYYVYQQSAYVDDVRFGILLPKGMYISSDAKATLDTGVEVPVEKISHKEINTEENFWIIELEGGYPIGYFTEDLQKLPNGTGVKLDLKVNTSKSINERMLYFADRMFVTGDEFVHAQQYFAKDTYGLTDYHSYDTVGIIVPEKAKSLQVIPQPAKMDDDNSLTVSSGMADQAHVTLKDKGDTVTYKLNIANTKGGTAENLAYYIQIPQNGFAEGSDDRLVLSGAGNVTLTSGTELELLYTTEKNLSLDTIADNDTEVEWAETVADYSMVTMVKVVTKGNAKFTNGSESTVTLPLSYKGEEFAACAGGKVNIMTQRNYRYVQGILSGTYAGLLQVLSVSTHYTAPEEVITLTAALEGKPTDPNVKEVTYETALNFHYAHSFKITDLKTNNVTLGAHSEETLAANSNTHFQINAKMNNGTEMVIAANGTDVGSLAAENALSFVFALTNGDALTDVTTERYVTFNISSEAVTIPVRININRELATAKPTESGIKAGKEYLNTGAATAVTIAKNSAFTVQFVTAEMNSTNYGARTLKFKNALPAGTTVAMLDYTSDAPRYAYYRVGAPTAEIALTSFKMMGSETPYALNNNTGTFTETLLFVVDFAKASSYLSGEQTVMIHIAGKNTIEDMESNELMFTLSGVSGFAASVDRESLAYGQSFTYNFNASRVGNDSTYSGRKMSAVITGENLPADAKLIVGDQAEYKQNANKQFIIPLGENGGSISICLDSVSLKNNHQDCKLTIKLWVSATPNDSKPHRGEHVIAQDKTVTYTAAMPSSLKVTDMSDRVLRKTELSSYVTLSYATARVPEGAAVTMEVQRYVGSGYVTDSTYLERLAPASGNAGVYTVANGGGNLSMKFSPTAMETGNYRILFKVTDSSGNVLLEVPYRFVVVD